MKIKNKEDCKWLIENIEKIQNKEIDILGVPKEYHEDEKKEMLRCNIGSEHCILREKDEGYHVECFNHHQESHMDFTKEELIDFLYEYKGAVNKTLDMIEKRYKKKDVQN